MIFIFLSEIPWFGLHQRPQHIVKALAKHWTVLWVEPTTLFKKSYFFPVQIEANIHIMSIPAIPYNARIWWVKLIAVSLSYLKPLRQVLSLIQFFLLRRGLKLLKGGHTSIGFFIHNFHLINILNRFEPALILFDYIDNAFGFTKLPKHVEDDWIKTIRQSDIITVTSPTLAKQIEPIRDGNVNYIGNGVEYSFFSNEKEYSRPLDLPNGKPIIGYIGAVYPWLDYSLIESLCVSIPEINVVFIGPLHPRVHSKIKRLKRLQNIYFLGFRKYQLIPQYLYHFDVGIIPFQKNELTSAVNPVKLYEYSAAGKPTVATNFSDDLIQFKDQIFIARSNEEFISLVQKALEKSKIFAFREKLKSFASQHDWERKTSTLIHLIKTHLSITPDY